jgi:hypothetical protein
MMGWRNVIASYIYIYISESPLLLGPPIADSLMGARTAGIDFGQ